MYILKQDLRDIMKKMYNNIIHLIKMNNIPRKCEICLGNITMYGFIINLEPCSCPVYYQNMTFNNLTDLRNMRLKLLKRAHKNLNAIYGKDDLPKYHEYLEYVEYTIRKLSLLIEDV